MSAYSSLSPLQRLGRLIPWAVLILTFALFGLPIVMIIFGAFRDAAPGQPGSWTTAGFVQAFQDRHTRVAFLNSLGLGFAMGGVGTILAAMLAFMSARSTSLFARLTTPLMVTVLAIPPLFFALSWDILGSPGVGLINQVIQPLGLPPLDLGGASGTIFVGGVKVASLAYFILLGPFRSMDHRLEEAARLSGSSALGTFLRITLPSLAPAILGAFIITFIIGLTAFDIPLIIGLPDGFNVFSTQIYGYLNETSPPNYAGAGSLGMVLVLTVIAVVALRWWLIDRRTFTTVGGKSGGALASESPLSKATAGIFFWAVALIALLLPIAQMVLASFQRIFGSNRNLGLSNYQEVLADPFLGDMLRNTFIVSVLGGLLAVLLAFVLAMIGRYGNRFMRRGLDLMTWLPWAANGVLLGLGLVWLFLTVPFLRGAFGTVWILLVGLVVAATPLASRTIEGALAQISAELEEAGRLSGATLLRVSVDIVLRLMAPAFFSGWFISAVHIIGNLEVPILLSMPTNHTLAVTVYRLWGNGQTAQAAALFCMVLAILILGGALLWLLLVLIRKLVRIPKDGLTPTLGAPNSERDEHATKLIAQQFQTSSRK